MTLIPGTRLGPYEIQTPIAAGGMGEVYKALDTRLDRVVAVKILLTPVADDPEFRARFEREARAISQLQHPHICTLHDIGSHEGTDYLVLEHLEGQTLADRITRGPVPLAEALTIASQVTDALDKAHRLGIIHRDLKPGNVMLTRSGAKLLDFGLAKTVAGPAPGATDLTAAATRGPVLSPDGRFLAYAALVDGDQALVVRDMTTGETRPVPDSFGSNTVFFSTDSRSLGFSSAMSLQRMTLSGGAPITVVDGLSTNLRGAAWGDDGYIYYTPFFSSGLFRVAAAGGSSAPAVSP